MKKRAIFLFSLGIIFTIVPYLFNEYALWRLFCLGFGIILLVLSLLFEKNRKMLLIIIAPLFLITLSYGFDFWLFYQFERIPIYTYEIKSSDQVSTLNSAFYRVYKCNNDLILDYGYEKSYACNDSFLNTIGINEFMANPEEAFNKYEGKFVKISGKISKIVGTEAIELSSYTQTENKLNSYVSFNLNSVLKVNTNKDLSKYRIFDVIEVIGKVDSLKKDNGTTIINLIDTNIIDSSIYDDYSYEVINNNDKKLINFIKNEDYYFYGITSLNIVYDEDNVYELSYLFNDTRFTWDMLISNSPAEYIKDKNDNVAKKYVLDKFNLLECDNGKKIVANKKLKLDNKVCEMNIK